MRAGNSIGENWWKSVDGLQSIEDYGTIEDNTVELYVTYIYKYSFKILILSTK